jgi:hypothetical protein
VVYHRHEHTWSWRQWQKVLNWWRVQRALGGVFSFLFIAFVACDAQSPTCTCPAHTQTCTCFAGSPTQLPCGANCGNALDSVMCECATDDTANLESNRQRVMMHDIPRLAKLLGLPVRDLLLPEWK